MAKIIRFVFLIVLFTLTTNCSQSNKNRLTSILNDELQEEGKEYAVYVIDATSCSACQGKLINRYSKEIKSKGNFMQYGIIFNDNKVKSLPFKFKEMMNEIENKDDIIWKEVNNIELMRLIAKLSESKIGPYMVVVENNEIGFLNTIR